MSERNEVLSIPQEALKQKLWVTDRALPRAWGLCVWLGGFPLIPRGHTEKCAQPLSSSSYEYARRTRLVVICSLLWEVLEMGLTLRRSPRSMRPIHDCPVAAWHARTCADPDRAEMITRRVTFPAYCRSFYPIKCRMPSASQGDISPQKTSLSSGELFQQAGEMAAIQGLLIAQNTIRNNQTFSFIASRYDK